MKKLALVVLAGGFALSAAACSGGSVDPPAAASTTTSTVNAVQLDGELQAMRAECSNIRLNAAIKNSVARSGSDSPAGVVAGRMFAVDDQELADQLRAAQLRGQQNAIVATPTQLELACLEGVK